MKLLALYLRDELDYKPKKRREILCEFCGRYIPNFSYAAYYKVVDRAITYSSNKKHKLTNIESIPVYASEFNYIQSLEIDDVCKKVLFTFLIEMRLKKIVYKIKNQREYNSIFFKGGKRIYNEMKKKSNIPASININTDIIHRLAENGLVTILFNGMIVLNYLEKMDTQDIKIISITNFDSIGYYYDFLSGKPRICICACCGSAFYKKKNKQKYCAQECSKKMKYIHNLQSKMKLKKSKGGK